MGRNVLGNYSIYSDGLFARGGEKKKGAKSRFLTLSVPWYTYIWYYIALRTNQSKFETVTDKYSRREHKIGKNATPDTYILYSCAQIRWRTGHLFIFWVRKVICRRTEAKIRTPLCIYRYYVRARLA